jgi:hypothetical protein
MRPVSAGGSALAEVSLDGVLFDDLSFYGPNRLNCQRSMTVWELEARRDRRYFREVYERAGRDALQQEMVTSMARQADRAGTHARVAHAARATNQSAERQVQFAFVDMPDAPVNLEFGAAAVAGNELRSPRVRIRNIGRKAITGVEIGWMVKDARGREFVSGGVPVELVLPPRGSTRIQQEGVFRFSHPDGPAILIEDLKAFLSSVEFEDGSLWVPRRSAGMRMPTPSPEEQRLVELYRRRGVDALIQELSKF